MKTLLTVDWDYFVPEDIELDLSHSESPLFLKMMWESRPGVIDKISSSGEEKGFWNRTGAWKGVTYVSDSHLFAYKLLMGIDHVLLVDAHHDCWHGDSLGIEKDTKTIYCHNWLRVWLSKGKRRRATWVVPKWSDGQFDLPKDMQDKVEIIRKIEDWKGTDIKTVHVCRSGCWTPPWLDRQFIEFVNARGGYVVPLQYDDWDPMRERWTDEKIEEIRDRDRVIAEQMKSLRVGTISSQDFVHAREEQAIEA